MSHESRPEAHSHTTFAAGRALLLKTGCCAAWQATKNDDLPHEGSFHPEIDRFLLISGQIHRSFNSMTLRVVAAGRDFAILIGMLLLLFLFMAAPPALEQIAAPAHGHVGVAIQLIETGESFNLHGGEHFPMQSVYKLPIAMAVLHDNLPLDRPVRIAKGDLVPAGLHSPIRDEHPGGDFDMPLREVLRYAIAESDGTASDVLLRLAGGPERVTAFLRTLGVTDMMIATSEIEMSREVHVQYRNWATPEGMVQLLTKLSPEHYGLLLKWMIESTPGPKRIKGLLPAGTIVAHKTGTSGADSGLTRATNDVGLVTLPDGRHLAIAVFVSDSPAEITTREEVIARIAREAWNRFTQSGH
jgi:beta-lactamase class A